MTETDKARAWRIDACDRMLIKGRLLLATEVDQLLAAYGAAQYKAGAASERRKCRRDPETGEYTDNYGD